MFNKILILFLMVVFVNTAMAAVSPQPPQKTQSQAAKGKVTPPAQAATRGSFPSQAASTRTRLN